MPTSPESQRTFTVLLVCTGNICRSAFAERLGRAYLAEALGGDAEQIRFVSAGVGAVVGSGMHPDSALVLEGFGGDSAGHVARRLDERLAGAPDLTLTMTRAHRAEVLRLAPRALARTFTLREAADLLRLVGDSEPAGDGLTERARALVRALADARPRRQSSDTDDVPDPMGRPLEAHQEAADLIAEALIPLLARIAALSDEPAGSSPSAGGTS